MQQRIKLKTTQDFNNFLASQPTPSALYGLRQSCFKEIEAIRGRPLLIYATKFLDAMPPNTPNFIDISDIDGFTDLVGSITETKSVDVLVHSPGGRPDATERIVAILRNKFEEVHFLVPHSAYSAATMLALSGNTVTLHPSATLGPIDPQLNGTPARSIKRGFEKVKEVIKNEGPEALPAYIPLIEKYTLDLLELCDDSERLSKELVSNWLSEYMFNGVENCEDKIKDAVEFFSDYDKHLLHSRPILFQKLTNFGLKIEQSTGDLSDLLWESYLMLNGLFMISPIVKLFENTRGVSWGRQLIMMQQPPQMQANPPRVQS